MNISEFQNKYSTEDKCLKRILNNKCLNQKLYRVKGRKSYADVNGKHISPLVGTIFENSSTPLTKWFYAIYLFSVSKNGVSSKELERALGVTYKCAWRIGKKIRHLMREETERLDGVVEMDETLVGGKKLKNQGGHKSAIVIGAIERGGRVKARYSLDRYPSTIRDQVLEDIHPKSTLITDEYYAYRGVTKLGYRHKTVNHSRYEYVRGSLSTNSIEGFWSQLKRGLKGTYVCVSRKHLQTYLDEAVYRHNHRHSSSLFEKMVSRV